VRLKALPRSARASLGISTGASHVGEAGVRVEILKFSLTPISKPASTASFFEIGSATKLAAVPVVAVAVPFQSAVQLPFPKKGASVTGVFVANLRPTGAASRKCLKNH
jgi:hypothetical protein